MQVFLQIVSFSLQTDRSGRPVLTKGKRPKIRHMLLWNKAMEIKRNLKKLANVAKFGHGGFKRSPKRQ